MCNLADIIFDHPDLTRSDIATYFAIQQLGPEAYRADIAEKVGVSEKTVSQAIKSLKLRGLITVDRRQVQPDVPGSPRTKKFYAFPGPEGARKQFRNIAPPMHDDDEINNDTEIVKDKDKTKTILNLLHFIDEGQRMKHATGNHCTVELAQQWNDWWHRMDFGDLYNPAGFANSEITKGCRPPLQMSLPAGIMPAGAIELPQGAEMPAAEPATVENQLTEDVFQAILNGPAPDKAKRNKRNLRNLVRANIQKAATPADGRMENYANNNVPYEHQITYFARAVEYELIYADGS